VNKQNWPEFPLWWLDQSKRNMEGLQDIASHLHDKTSSGRNSRAGFVGDASEMDKQIITNVTALEQQVYVLTDVVQSALQIIAKDHWRRTHRVERLFAWIGNVARKVETKLSANVFYRILAIASTLGLLLGLVKFLLHIMRSR